MKRPVRLSGGRIRYTGRIAREMFAAWAESPQGEAVVEQAAAAQRFSLLGRRRAARRGLWRRLATAASAEPVAAAVQRELDRFLAPLDTLAHANGLPCERLELYRLVVVPRLFVNAEGCRRLDRALASQTQFAAVGGGVALRDWFILTLVDAIDTTLADARPSVRHPLAAGDGWIVVAVNTDFEWRVPFSGPAWRGHYYVLDRSPASMTRAFRKAATERIAHLEEWLPSRTRFQRDDILRQAGSSLTRLVGTDVPLIVRERA
jgi:hypothetical protein